MIDHVNDIGVAEGHPINNIADFSIPGEDEMPPLDEYVEDDDDSMHYDDNPNSFLNCSASISNINDLFLDQKSKSGNSNPNGSTSTQQPVTTNDNFQIHTAVSNISDLTDNIDDSSNTISNGYSDNTQYPNTNHHDDEIESCLENNEENKNIRIENNDEQELTLDNAANKDEASESIQDWINMPRRSRRVAGLDLDPNFGNAYLTSIGKISPWNIASDCPSANISFTTSYIYDDEPHEILLGQFQ